MLKEADYRTTKMYELRAFNAPTKVQTRQRMGTAANCSKTCLRMASTARRQELTPWFCAIVLACLSNYKHSVSTARRAVPTGSLVTVTLTSFKGCAQSESTALLKARTVLLQMTIWRSFKTCVRTASTALRTADGKP